MALTRLGPNNSANISGINLTSQVTGTLPAGNGGTGSTTFSPGKIGQVVYGSTNVKVQGSGGGFTDTGLSASITPTATSSKVLVLVTQQTLKGNSANAAGYIYLQLQRQIGGGGYSTQKFVTSVGNYLAGTSTGDKPIGANEYSLNFLDTTNTTSQVDYKTTMTNDTGMETQPDDTSGAERGESSMILMEILA